MTILLLICSWMVFMICVTHFLNWILWTFIKTSPTTHLYTHKYFVLISYNSQHNLLHIALFISITLYLLFSRFTYLEIFEILNHFAFHTWIFLNILNIENQIMPFPLKTQLPWFFTAQAVSGENVLHAPLFCNNNLEKRAYSQYEIYPMSILFFKTHTYVESKLCSEDFRLTL